MNYDTTTVRGAGEFVSLAKTLMRAKGNKSDALMYAEQDKVPDRVARVLQKATPGGTTSENWAALVDYQLIASGFLESLRSIGVFDRMVAEGMKRAPLRTHCRHLDSGRGFTNGRRCPEGYRRGCSFRFEH